MIKNRKVPLSLFSLARSAFSLVHSLQHWLSGSPRPPHGLESYNLKRSRACLVLFYDNRALSQGEFQRERKENGLQGVLFSQCGLKNGSGRREGMILAGLPVPAVPCEACQPLIRPWQPPAVKCKVNAWWRHQGVSDCADTCLVGEADPEAGFWKAGEGWVMEGKDDEGTIWKTHFKKGREQNEIHNPEFWSPCCVWSGPLESPWPGWA